MRSWRFFKTATLLMTTSIGCSDLPPNVEQETTAVTSDDLLRGVQQAQLLPTEPNQDGHFGWAVTIEGNTAVVSMTQAKASDGSEFKGAVYVFEFDGSIWSQTAYIQSPLDVQNRFGTSIAMKGDLLVVGTPHASSNQGAVFVYARNGGTWTLEAQVVDQDGLGTRAFGSSVALSGNTLLVKDYESLPAGAAYVFVRNAGSWSQEARIAWDEKYMDHIALSNDTAVITSSMYTRIFTRTGTTWALQADLDHDWPTQSMALDGDTLAFAGIDGLRIFSRSGTNWTKAADVWPGIQIGHSYFGSAMAINEQRIAVGSTAFNAPGPGPGFAYTFHSSAGLWTEEARIEGEKAPMGDSFSASLAISGTTILVGAPYDDKLASNGGAAYIYELAPGLENGTACAKSTECASGFCIDGVCCDVLCAGTCTACISAKKGQGADGVCGPIVIGSDPDAECVKEDPNTCGTTGECNGSGACEVYSPGTECDDGNPCTENDTCTSGACSGAPRQCELPDVCHLPGQCNVSTGECEYPLINPTDPACSPQPAACGCSMVGERQTRLSWTMAGLWFLLRRRKSSRRSNLKDP
jgi:hypothetical protein